MTLKTHSATHPASRNLNGRAKGPGKDFEQFERSLDAFHAKLRRKYDIDEKGELALPKVEPLTVDKITPENIRRQCEIAFYEKNEKPQPVSIIFCDPYYEKKRELRFLGWYFRECGINGKKILIEVKREPKKEIFIDFPESVNSFQRKSTKNLIERLAPGFDVHLRRTPATEHAMSARKPRKVRPSKELDVDVDHGDKFAGARDPFAEAARMVEVD